MRLKRYLTESKLRLKRNGPGNYYAEMGRIYVSVWQAENKQFWGANVTIGQYGDDDFEDQDFHASTKNELMGYLNNFVKKNQGAIKRTPKRY